MAIDQDNQRSEDRALHGPNVFVARHPLILHHLTRLRDVKTEGSGFRLLIHRLAVLLAYEATKDLSLKSIDVRTPLTDCSGHRLAQRVGLIPILRAGLGMVDPILDLIPSAEVWHLGLYRDEETARPVQYYSKLPEGRPVDVALIVDPMLATGGSAVAAVEKLQKWGVKHIKLLSVIAAPEGLREVATRFPETQVYVCVVDQKLNDRKFIVPGLGDAGDRIFNTPS